VINRANGLPVVINTLLIDPAVNLAQIQAKGVTVTIVPAAGTKLIRFRIFAPGGKGVVARAGHRHGRLIAEFFRTVNGGRRIQMHLRGAAVRRLTTGRYELEATPGVSRRSLGRPVTREFRVQR
jgi:hypothetical protein